MNRGEIQKVEIREDACVGCGKCVRDCIAQNLFLKDRKAAVAGGCILCGHCVAICPQGAVSIPEYDMADVEACTPENAGLDAARLLRAVKFRRSIRDYLPRAVEEEKIRLVLQAGRYTATAKNTQGCRFILVQRELETLKKMVWDGIGRALSLPPDTTPAWVQRFRKFHADRKANPAADYLFRNAPAVLFIAADRTDDAALAAQNMELVAVSLGLGALYNGYLCQAAEENPEVRQWLEAGEKPLALCALLGYPAVTYARTAPRRAGDFILK